MYVCTSFRGAKHANWVEHGGSGHVYKYRLEDCENVGQTIHPMLVQL